MSPESSSSRESFPRRLFFWWINAASFGLVEIATAVDPAGAEPAWLLLTALGAYLAVATVGALGWHFLGPIIARVPGLGWLDDRIAAFAPGAFLVLTKVPAALSFEVTRTLPFLAWAGALAILLLFVGGSLGRRGSTGDSSDGGWLAYTAACLAIWIPALRIEHMARVAETHSEQVVISPMLAWLLTAVAGAWVLLILGAERLGLSRAMASGGGALVMGALLAWRLLAPSPFDLGMSPVDERLGRGTPLIVIVMDTTRADHLSLYGYPRATSPNLERFAEDAVIFENAVSTSSWTLPSHTSLFTGLLPLTHGALRLPGLADEKESLAAKGIHRPAYPLPAETPTLAEHLQAEGFTTAAMIANFAYLDPVFGVDRGFETYFTVRNTPVQPMVLRLIDRRVSPLPWARRYWQVYRSAEQINRLAFEWLRAQETHRFFLFLNYMEPHLPWGPHQPGLGYEAFAAEAALPDRPGGSAAPESQWKERVDLYDSNIASLDQRLGELFDGLREMGLYDRSMIVVTSDHGESFGENGADGHGKSLNEAEVWIPLLVKYPDSQEKGRRSERVELVDLAPSLTEAMQRPFPARVDGSTFVKIAEWEAAQGEVETRDVDGVAEATEGISAAPEQIHGPGGEAWVRLAEMYGDPTDTTGAFGGYQVAYYDGDRKLLVREDGEITYSTRATGLENPVALPDELRPWAEAQRDELLERRHLLEQLARSRQQALELDPEIQKGLEALGYL